MGLRRITSLYLRYHLVMHGLLLVAVCFLVYANGYHHAYNLDSGYGLVDNSYVRSLENIPLFFKDPLTLTSLRANGDYRPVLQTTYAINYAISGYEMWSWHLTQILLHAICVLCLCSLCRRLLREFHPKESHFLTIHVPLLAALVFAVHPANSGVVNYLWARSSLLVAAFLFPSILLYLRQGDSRVMPRTPWLACVLYTLALFTKVEAVSALGVFFLCDVLRSAFERMQIEGTNAQERVEAPSTSAAGPLRSRGFIGDIIRALNLQTLKRLWPFLVVTLIYAGLRSVLVPDFISEARHASDVSHTDYLFTQATAWWHYVLRWLAPVRLVADNLTYPTFCSPLDPAVLLSLIGWLAVAVICKATYRTHPHITFLVLAALALISPTSSFMPLAEMVNEHRPYMPLAVLSLVWLMAGSIGISKLIKGDVVAKWLVVVFLSLLLLTLGWLTWQRNRVFHTNESYWADVQQKAPSCRSENNYGLVLMGQGRWEQAGHHFDAALEDCPYWHIAHINRALVYQRQNQDDLALEHFSAAVTYDRYSSAALKYRGDFYLSRQQYRLAVDDYERSLEKAREPFEITRALATAYAGLGDGERCFWFTRAAHQLDSIATERSIVAISTPFWESEDRYAAGIEYYRALDTLMPDRWWIYQNIAGLASRLGREQEAQDAYRRVDVLRSTSQP